RGDGRGRHDRGWVLGPRTGFVVHDHRAVGDLRRTGDPHRSGGVRCADAFRAQRVPHPHLWEGHGPGDPRGASPMSLQGAAEQMGVHEAIVRRAAEARAKAAGASTDDILAAWAGGEAAPAGAPPPPADTPAAEPDATPAEPTPAPTAEPAAAAAPAAPAEPAPTVAAGPSTPPVLVGREEHLTGALVGALALLAVSLLVGFFVA